MTSSPKTIVDKLYTCGKDLEATPIERESESEAMKASQDKNRGFQASPSANSSSSP